jgi:hypothetical protein
VASLIGPRLAVSIGSKLVVALGLISLSVAFAWASTIGADTSYLVVASQMLFLGAGIGLTSAPATEAIMGVVSPDKAGMGSAVNDATRELGGTLGVAVIGSVALSVYRDALDQARLPAPLMDPARDSIGAALAASEQAAATMGEVGVRAAQQLTEIAQRGYIDGFSTGCLVAAAVTAAAAVLTLIYLPAHPHSTERESDEHTANTDATVEIGLDSPPSGGRTVDLDTP